MDQKTMWKGFPAVEKRILTNSAALLSFLASFSL